MNERKQVASHFLSWLFDPMIWVARYKRYYLKSLIKSRDLEVCFEWYLRGGRHFFNKYYSEIVNAHKWCFIVGCNNSGTTLLQKILKNTGCISTLKSEGQRYTTIFQRSERKKHRRIWSEYIDRLEVNHYNVQHKAPRLLHDWMRDLENPIKEIIVEKTPANTFRMAWLQEAFPRSYFIGLVRNGYAVAEGIHRKGNQSFESAARHWTRVNRELIDQSANIKRFITVYYEDLIQKPVETTKMLADFLEINRTHFDGAMAATYQAETVLGPINSQLRNFNVESLGKITPENQVIIRSHAKEMLDYFGYKFEA